MARRKRPQILFESEEYGRLEGVARRRGTSVAELVRRAVGEKHLSDPAKRRAAVDTIRGMSLPLPDWPELEEEIADARADAFS